MRLVNFDIQHHENASLKSDQLRSGNRHVPVHALSTGSIPFTLGAGALRVDPVRWSLVVQYGADRGGSVRVYITR